MNCKKRRYKTELDAKIALMSARKKHDTRNNLKIEKRWYRCPRCKGYHLTSKS